MDLPPFESNPNLYYQEFQIPDDSTMTVEESHSYTSYRSETTSAPSSDTPHAPKGGRPKLPETSLLSSFRTVKNNTLMRKENLRVCTHRGCVACLEHWKKQGAMSRRINHLFDSSSLYYHHSLTSLYDYYSLHQPSIDALLTTPKQKKEKSHNTRFFSRLYGNPYTVTCMRMYIDFLFVDMRPEVISKKLGVTCCSAKEHGMECLEKWENLKEYCLKKLFSFN